jgi:hypothetical protein
MYLSPQVDMSDGYWPGGDYASQSLTKCKRIYFLIVVQSTASSLLVIYCELTVQMLDCLETHLLTDISDV